MTMTHAETIDKLAALREGYAAAMHCALMYHTRIVEAEAKATEDDRLAAASRPSAFPEPVGVHWPTRVTS